MLLLNNKHMEKSSMNAPVFPYFLWAFSTLMDFHKGRDLTCISLWKIYKTSFLVEFLSTSKARSWTSMKRLYYFWELHPHTTYCQIQLPRLSFCSLLLSTQIFTCLNSLETWVTWSAGLMVCHTLGELFLE